MVLSTSHYELPLPSRCSVNLVFSSPMGGHVAMACGWRPCFFHGIQNIFKDPPFDSPLSTMVCAMLAILVSGNKGCVPCDCGHIL
jgi:hypothetical protein